MLGLADVMTLESMFESGRKVAFTIGPLNYFDPGFGSRLLFQAWSFI